MHSSKDPCPQCAQWTQKNLNTKLVFIKARKEVWVSKKYQNLLHIQDHTKPFYKQQIQVPFAA